MKPPPHLPAPCPDPSGIGVPSGPAGDPLGHEAWAAELGIAPATALVLGAVTLAHLAGPTLQWDHGSGLAGKRLPGLLGAESDSLLRNALGRLTADLRVKQARLLQASLEFTEAEVERVFLAGLAGDSELERLRWPARDGSSLENSPDMRLLRMLQHGDRARLRDNLLRPVFMVDSLPSGPLDPLLRNCNHGACFLAGAVEMLPPGPGRRNQRIDEFIRFMDGAITESRRAPTERLRQVTLNGVFLFGQADIRWLLEHRRDFLRRLVPVFSAPPGPDDPIRLDPDKAHTFEKAFIKAAVLVLAQRRAHAPSVAAFRSDGAARDFRLRRRRHLLQSANAPADCTALPDLLMWFLLWLAPKAAEEELVGLAIDTAATLHRSACRAYVQQADRQAGLKRRSNALKMLDRIVRHGPMKRRELVRIFDRQKLTFHAPVIDALLAGGFLREDGDRMLHLGPVPSSRLTADQLLLPDPSPETPNPEIP